MKSLLLLKKIAPIFVTVLVAAFVLGYYFIGDNDHDMLQRPEDIEMVEKDAEQPSDDTIMDNIGPRTTYTIHTKTYYTMRTYGGRQAGYTYPAGGFGREGLLAHYPGWDGKNSSKKRNFKKGGGAAPALRIKGG